MVYVHANQAYRPSRAIGKIDTDTVLRVRGDIPIYRGIERVSGRWLTRHKAIASVKVRSTGTAIETCFLFSIYEDLNQDILIILLDEWIIDDTHK